MSRLLLLAATFCASTVWAQDYKFETISTPPPNLPTPYAAMIDSNGYRIVGPSGTWCEVWFRKAVSSPSKPADDAIVLPFTQGTLIGIIRFPGPGSDRRGQTVKAGTYTLRYSNYPVDGAHQGVAPQRDFALLSPLSKDSDPNATPAFQALVDASINGVGTPHPAVLALEAPAGPVPTLVKQGDSDWALNAKIGGVTFGIILVGKTEG